MSMKKGESKVERWKRSVDYWEHDLTQLTIEVDGQIDCNDYVGCLRNLTRMEYIIEDVLVPLVAKIKESIPFVNTDLAPMLEWVKTIKLQVIELKEADEPIS